MWKYKHHSKKVKIIVTLWALFYSSALINGIINDEPEPTTITTQEANTHFENNNNVVKDKEHADNKKKSETKEVKKKAKDVKPEKQKEAEPLFFDIHDIAKKTEEEVNVILGQPNDVETGNWTLYHQENIDPLNPPKIPYIMNYYKNDKVEVMFLEGEAARIRVNLTKDELEKYGYENAIKLINLEPKKINFECLSCTIDIKRKQYTALENDDFNEVTVADWMGEPGGFIFVNIHEKFR